MKFVGDFFCFLEESCKNRVAQWRHNAADVGVVGVLGVSDEGGCGGGACGCRLFACPAVCWVCCSARSALPAPAPASREQAESACACACAAWRPRCRRPARAGCRGTSLRANTAATATASAKTTAQRSHTRRPQVGRRAQHARTYPRANKHACARPCPSCRAPRRCNTQHARTPAHTHTRLCFPGLLPHRAFDAA